jgi:FixJ family two-component response regulator
VLIANGDRLTRDWIEATVAATGLRVLSFDSASELLSHFTCDTAACAILDLTPADTTGFDLQDALARAGASVLVVSREQSISACVRAIKAGAVDFLSMPCDAIELVRALRSAIHEAVHKWSQRKRLNDLRCRFDQLTKREREVFALVSIGWLNKQIAQQLDISEITVQIHRGRAMRKMSVRSIPELVRIADQLRLPTPPTSESDLHRDR